MFDVNEGWLRFLQSFDGLLQMRPVFKLMRNIILPENYNIYSALILSGAGFDRLPCRAN